VAEVDAVRPFEGRERAPNLLRCGHAAVFDAVFRLLSRAFAFGSLFHFHGNVFGTNRVWEANCFVHCLWVYSNPFDELMYFAELKPILPNE
jgi:hypothetical protein